MFQPVHRLIGRVAQALRERRDLLLEILALRQQIAVLERSLKRPRFSTADRIFWVVLSYCWELWPQALEIVEPETVLRWRRRGRRPRWRWRWQGRQLGRPPIDRETRRLIRRLNLDNFLWGAPRIHGELRMLGIHLAQSTVAKYMIRRSGPPSQTWRTFLRNHARELLPSEIAPQTRRRVSALGASLLSRILRGFPVSLCSNKPHGDWFQGRTGTSVSTSPINSVLSHRIYGRGRGPPFPARMVTAASPPSAVKTHWKPVVHPFCASEGFAWALQSSLRFFVAQRLKSKQLREFDHMSRASLLIVLPILICIMFP